jgi:4-hydroxy-tetrahydrodipicolinate synthase
MGRIAGVLAPVLTPFGPDLAPDPKRLLDHSRWLLSKGVGLAVFGTTSEANSLSADERTSLLEHLLGNGVDPGRVIVGTGCSALPDSVRLTAHAVAAGCAGVLMLPPFYYKGVSDDGLFRSYAEVVERVGDTRLRIYLYHIPPVSQVPISTALIERLLEAYPEVVVGAKDSSGDWSNTETWLDRFAERGFDVFPGSETFLLRGLRNGAAGCISATANANPAAIARLFEKWQEPDADARQQALDEVRNAFSRHPLIPALKAAVAHHSGDETWSVVRPPLVALAATDRAILMRDLEGIRFAMPGLTQVPAA